MQKARSQRTPPAEAGGRLLPLVGVRFQDLFHSPHRGAFHLSLTVLVRYRSHGSLQPWRVVPPASRPVPRAGRYSGTPLRQARGLRLPGSHRLWRPVPGDFGWLKPDASAAPTPPALSARGRFRPGRPEGRPYGPVRSPLLGASRVDFSSSGY